VKHPAAISARDLIDAAVVGLIALGLFVATLQPDFGGPEDTPKFQFVGYVLGTPHPPGYPLYVLLSHLFVTVVPIGTIAYRANLFSAVMAAAACALVYLMARQIRASRWPAACVAIALAAGTSFWRNAVFAEVYSLAAGMAALTLVLLLNWGARGGTARVLAAVAAIGLGSGNHLTIAGLAPACVVYVLWRDRKVVTARFVMAAAAILVACWSQYLFIIVRSLQGAPYLESRAGSLSALLRVVRAEDFADKRFAFGLSTLFAEQVPAVGSVIGHELGIAGVALFAVGLIAAWRQRNASAGLVTGAAVGTLAMIVNLAGDFQGFITPLVIFLWPIAALGVDAVRAFVATRGLRAGAPAVAIGLAAMMPAANVFANYRDADRSDQTEQGRYFRSLYAQLPEGAAVIAEDYFFDMALRYLMLTGEGGRDKGIAPVGFGVGPVRDARRLGRRVFAFGRAAAFLGAEGWAFERTPLDGPPLADWIKQLPRGSVVAGAAAYSAVPSEWSATFHRDAAEAARARPFTAFAFVTGRRGAEWRESETAASLTLNPQLLPAAAPPLPGAVVAVADEHGSRVTIGDRAIAAADMGLAIGVFRSDGTLWRMLEFRSGEPLHVAPEAALYELTEDTPCVNVSTEWTDVQSILSTGSWLTTFPPVGSVRVETAADDASCTTARGAELLGGGAARPDSATRTAGGIDFVAELTRGPILRPLFRLALDCVPQRARARVVAGGIATTIKACGQKPPPLFAGDRTHALIRADFESEAYFGAGWHDAERTPTGRTRRGDERATLLLPLTSGFSYDIAIDVVATTERIDVSLNGAALTRCHVARSAPCEMTLPAAAVKAGVNAITLSIAGGAPADRSTPLTFRGARLVRTPT
jgi:hypothetical protein